MFRVLSCLGGQHDLRLVALAALECLVTSLVAISLFHHARRAAGRARLAWVVATGAASGCGIWATHFIAMLAYEPGVPVAYDVVRTVLSFVVAGLVMTAAIAVAVHAASRSGALLGGLLIGVAIASMHFLGMSALEIPGRVTWSLDLVAASIVFGMVFGAASLWAATRGSDVATTLLAASAFAAATVTMHFTAMGAIAIVPDPRITVTPFSLSPNLLAFGVAAASMVALALGAVGSMFDQRVSEKTEQLDAALNNMRQGLCMLNAKSEVVIVNRRFAQMFGFDYERIRPGMNVTELFDLADQAVPIGAETRAANREWMRDLARQGRSGKRVFQRTDGRAFTISQDHMPESDGWIQTYEDITELRRAEDRISHMARHDPLTDLPNRRHFGDRLDDAVASLDSGGGFAVLCLDLDDFKAVNDTLGHHSGDELLCIAATRLRGTAREADVVARLGGDEFAVLQLTSNQPAAATALARRLVEVMREPIAIGDEHVHVGVSVGVALAPQDGQAAEQLMGNADTALYRAKTYGRGCYQFFDPAMDAEMQERRALELELRRALAAGELTLYYQPIFNIAADQVSAFEALIRWRHPSRGMIPPLQFIPLAEHIGAIIPIGDWVLHQACAQAVKWPARLRIAVNVSPVQVKSANLVKTVRAALDSSGLPAQRLELEITETALLGDDKAILDTLNRLRELGVAIALDDFGTGYSSLSYLRRFPFSKIKIDQTFIRDSTENSDSLAILRAVIGLGRNLGISTCAEGVETAEQLRRLKAEGCSEAQGFYFSRPEPADEAIQHCLRARPCWSPHRAQNTYKSPPCGSDLSFATPEPLASEANVKSKSSTSHL